MQMRMNMKGGLVMAVIGMLCCITHQAAAQNFAGWKPEQENSQDVPDPGSEDFVEQVMSTTADSDNSLTLQGSSKYTLGATDVIAIEVMRHPEVSGMYEINKEGKIQYEFVGDVMIAGLTKDEAADKVAKILSEYIISPEVTVKISQYNSKIVYVVGEVYRPGKIYMRGDTITIREALMQAGLPMLSGVTKKSRLITPSQEGKGNKREVNVYALLYEGDLRENYVMKPGDVLYIPPTFLTKTMRAISPVAAPLGTTANMGADIAGYPYVR